MKYYLIHDSITPTSKQLFFQANPHLTDKLTLINLSDIHENLRNQLKQQQWITQDNQYDNFNLAITKTHLELWQNAAQNKNDITIFQANTIAHPDILNYQIQFI